MVRVIVCSVLLTPCIAFAQDESGVICWKDPSFDPFPYDVCPENPLPLEAFTKVSTSGNSGFGLRPDGSIEHWGSCISYQCYVPIGEFTDVCAVGAGGAAINTDGQIVYWGSVDQLAFRLQTVDAEFKSISSDGYSYYALTVDDVLWSARNGQGNQGPVVVADNVRSFSSSTGVLAYTTNDGNYGYFSTNTGASASFLINGIQDLIFNNGLDPSTFEFHGSRDFRMWIHSEDTGQVFGVAAIGGGFDLLTSPQGITYRSFHANPYCVTVVGIQDDGNAVAWSDFNDCNFLAQEWISPGVPLKSASPSRCHILGIIDGDSTNENLCPEDVDGDGFVDFNDLIRVVAAWGPCSG